MSVPNDVVGSVIGKRGSKINEIRQIRFGKKFKTCKCVSVGPQSTSWKVGKRGGREAQRGLFVVSIDCRGREIHQVRRLSAAARPARGPREREVAIPCTHWWNIATTLYLTTRGKHLQKNFEALVKGFVNITLSNKYRMQ